jgi:ATP-dependent Clp protease adaptor protein ClpS
MHLMTEQPAGGTAVAERTHEARLGQEPWVCIVWNDPVNTMQYVTYVFQTYFGFTKEKATRLMLEVHNDGRSAVAMGTKDEMERDVTAMQGYGLWATLEPAA